MLEFIGLYVVIPFVLGYLLLGGVGVWLARRHYAKTKSHNGV